MYARASEELKYGSRAFSNPFYDFSSRVLPRNLAQAFSWSEMIWNRLDIYREGLQKVVRYFMTDVEIAGPSWEREKEWRKLLNKRMDIINVCAELGDNYLAMGNSISSIFFPFVRYLRCPKCQLVIRGAHFDYSYSKGGFVASCPKCNYKGRFDSQDRKVERPDRIHVISWNPKEIKLIFNPISGETRYIWKIPSDLREKLTRGEKFYLDTTPIEIIDAANDGCDLLLNRELVYHLKFSNLAGVTTGGWGIPPILASFGQIYYTQLLKKYNEAYALDYLIPLRVITPAIGPQSPGSGQDPLRSTGRGLPLYQSKILEMIEKRRRDPTAWFALPFPVQYGALGGEGVSMIRPDLIEQASGDLLNGLGVPVEFYRGNLRWRGDPQAVRLLEKRWEHLSSAINGWLDWATDIIAMAWGWEEVDASLQPPSMFDDMSRKQLLLQLAAEGQVSMRTALDPWHIDTAAERKKILQEQREQREEQEAAEMEQAASAPPIGVPAQAVPAGPGGAPAPPAGMPPAAGPAAAPQSISEMSALAEQYAGYFLGLPPPIRRSQMLQMQHDNDALYAITKQKMDQMKGPVELQGKVMAREQAFGAV